MQKQILSGEFLGREENNHKKVAVDSQRIVYELSGADVHRESATKAIMDDRHIEEVIGESQNSDFDC